ASTTSSSISVKPERRRDIVVLPSVGWAVGTGVRRRCRRFRAGRFTTFPGIIRVSGADHKTLPAESRHPRKVLAAARSAPILARSGTAIPPRVEIAASAGMGVQFMASPLERWVQESADLTRPAQVVWCDSSEEENRRLIAGMVAAGTLRELNS